MKLLKGITKYFHLIKWKKCHVCGDSFVRESGWKIVNQGLMSAKEIFVCKEYKKTIHDINKYVVNMDYVPKFKKVSNAQKVMNSLYERRKD